MLDKLKIKNKIIVLFSLLYAIYLSIILVYTYSNNVKILTESLKNRMIEHFYQLSYSIGEDVRIDNTYQINQKVQNIAAKTEEIAYIIVYDNEKNVIGKNIRDIPETILDIKEDREAFINYNSSRGKILDYAAKIEDIDIGYIKLGFYTKEIYSKTYSEFLKIIFLNTSVYIMLIIIAYYISKSIEHPISKLTAVTNEISTKEDYNTLLTKEQYSKDFHSLIESINHMITSNEKNKKLKNRLLNKVFKVQEDERKILSRELHDEVSQSLASLLVLITNLEQKELDLEKKKRLTLIKSELDSSLSNIRNIAVNLRPPILEEHGIIEAITKHIEEYSALYKINIKFESNITFIENDNFNITIYRIIQECLSNIKKHSAATEVKIKFFQTDLYTILEIMDNGIGFPLERISSARQEGRLGVYGIKERVLDFNGKFNLTSSPEYKTIIKCIFENKNIYEV